MVQSSRPICRPRNKPPGMGMTIQVPPEKFPDGSDVPEPSPLGWYGPQVLRIGRCPRNFPWDRTQRLKSQEQTPSTWTWVRHAHLARWTREVPELNLLGWSRLSAVPGLSLGWDDEYHVPGFPTRDGHGSASEDLDHVAAISRRASRFSQTR
jgi:hypothetical protein